MTSTPATSVLDLTPNETLGVIVGIVVVATFFILLSFVSILICHYVWRCQNKRSVHMMHESNSFMRTTTNRASLRSQRISKLVADNSEGPSTTNTFNIDAKPLSDEGKSSSPFPAPPVSDFPSVEKIELQDVRIPSNPLDMIQFPRGDLLLLDKLGEGEYGPIYRGEAYGLKVPQESHPVTVKMLAQQDTDENRSMFDADIEMLSCINHDHVVGMLAACTQDTPQCVLLDAGLPGDLLTFMREKKLETTSAEPTFEETYNILRLADEISMGMIYLTSERFVHKDLSLRNCIIGYNGVVKISHFGLGPVLYPEAYYRIHDTDLPIRWMAPEAITNSEHTTMSDVWSFGVILWELFTYGKLPYFDKTNEEVITYVVKNFKKLDLPRRCPENIFRVAVSCWSLNPQARPSFMSVHEQVSNLAGGGLSDSFSQVGSTPARSPNYVNVSFPIPGAMDAHLNEAMSNFH